MRFRAVLVALIGLAVIAPDAGAVGPNLLPNASFEDGVNDVAAQGVDQPLLPVGWAFEGAAGLFDHSPHERKTGRYSAAISIPAGGKRKVCYDAPVGCHDNVPLNTVKDTVATAYTTNPAYRPVYPVPVAAGKRYVVSGWFMWTLASIGEGGVLVRVRWLDANGAPIRIDRAFVRTSVERDQEVLNWKSFSATLTAPTGAVQAVPLFGANDDVFISKINYDDVSFHAA